MPAIKIDLTLTFTTPPSVGAGGVSGTLADKVVTRNASGEFIIPASQLKGKLRHACEQLLRAQGVPLCRPPRGEQMCPQVSEDEDAGKPMPRCAEDKYKDQPRCLLCQIFGSPAYPSRLRFHDLIAVQDNLPDETLRQMVSLNRRRRTAEDKRLFTIETAPNFAGLQFRNSEAITGRLRPDETKYLHLLLAGLKMLFAWGGSSSRGLGWASGETRAWLDDVETPLDLKEVKACR
jgi:CRISPR/Cas system CSM-associated protein Csm3 (group 7 of RAMP superfamily)